MKESDTLYPKILVRESDDIIAEMADEFFLGLKYELGKIAHDVAFEMHGFIEKYVPKHLMGDYWLFVMQTAGGLLDGMVEKCIELGVIDPHMQAGPGAEGVVMVVER